MHVKVPGALNCPAVLESSLVFSEASVKLFQLVLLALRLGREMAVLCMAKSHGMETQAGLSAKVSAFAASEISFLKSSFCC